MNYREFAHLLCTTLGVMATRTTYVVPEPCAGGLFLFSPLWATGGPRLRQQGKRS
jgi:hypothetical protein